MAESELIAGKQTTNQIQMKYIFHIFLFNFFRPGIFLQNRSSKRGHELHAILSSFQFIMFVLFVPQL